MPDQQPQQRPDPVGSRDARQRAEQLLSPRTGERVQWVFTQGPDDGSAQQATAWALLACAAELREIRRHLERRK
ncbi:hypothetical protein ACF1BN_15830 [Streptomyces sp. NPDC014861]|uniref:hypothetical protein n=1 Tax=Streptomyces sp. NPDC014861 TaxID=3364923 RepID=UPI0036F9F595